jgi:alpha-beta hydrolase superfamily lysophospholipase
MGCAVTLKYCITKKHDIKGIILFAPLFGIDDKLKPHFLIVLILTIVSYFFPEIPLLSNNLASIAINNNDYIYAKNENIFSYKGKHRLNTCREMVKISDWIYKNGHLLETPILIFHGLKDTITNPLITKTVFDKMISKDKELNLLENGYHCLLIESVENPYLPGYIIGKIIYWINERCK